MAIPFNRKLVNNKWKFTIDEITTNDAAGNEIKFIDGITICANDAHFKDVHAKSISLEEIIINGQQFNALGRSKNEDFTTITAQTISAQTISAQTISVTDKLEIGKNPPNSRSQGLEMNDSLTTINEGIISTVDLKLGSLNVKDIAKYLDFGLEQDDPYVRGPDFVEPILIPTTALTSDLSARFTTVSAFDIFTSILNLNGSDITNLDLFLQFEDPDNLPEYKRIFPNRQVLDIGVIVRSSDILSTDDPTDLDDGNYHITTDISSTNASFQFLNIINEGQLNVAKDCKLIADDVSINKLVTTHISSNTISAESVKFNTVSAESIISICGEFKELFIRAPTIHPTNHSVVENLKYDIAEFVHFLDISPLDAPFGNGELGGLEQLYRSFDQLLIPRDATFGNVLLDTITSNNNLIEIKGSTLCGEDASFQNLQTSEIFIPDYNDKYKWKIKTGVATDVHNIFIEKGRNTTFSEDIYEGRSESLLNFYYQDEKTHEPRAIITSFTETKYTNLMNFTGQHRCYVNKNVNENHIGLVVSTTGNYLNLDNGIMPTINDSLPICALTNVDNDKKVFGVLSYRENNTRTFFTGNFVSIFEKFNSNENRFHINSTGEGAIWVCDKNGTLENGDYITSTSIPGYSAKQILLPNCLTKFTVAKITCNCNFNLDKIKKQIPLVNYDENNNQILQNDSNGYLKYTDYRDSLGNVKYDYIYETRFIDADGNLLTNQDEYFNRLYNNENVYIACFVGCTYHCG
tara:strand:- start:8250 stop:10493 length:2244 start_codon:yes stop_codon:yes gene_type:complete